MSFGGKMSSSPSHRFLAGISTTLAPERITSKSEDSLDQTRSLDVIEHEGEDDPETSISIATWNWHHVEPYMVITWFVLLSGLAKIIFHQTQFISARVPESCLLIIVGVFFGGILHLVDKCDYEDDCDESKTLKTFPEFTPELFFYFLLPPIILEAAYSLYNRVFLENLRTILFYAVFGTVFNFSIIGGLLTMLYNLDWMGSHEVFQRTLTIKHNNLTENPETVTNVTVFSSITETQVFLFASLISAVDPVAVLAIFSEVGVNADLYFLVFGESLLNDGVAVVLYNMMSSFAGMEHAELTIGTGDIFTAIFSFFTIALGGFVIGLAFGVTTAVVTKYTKQVRVVEPLAIFSLSYLAYLTAELFHWSGILSLIGCGLIQAHYAFKNISTKSHTTISYFIKMLSSTCDCIIFLYLGMAMFGEHVWHTGFVCWTIVICLLVRFVGVFLQTSLVNLLRHDIKVINYQEQFIMAYGGLRGAVGFSLVMMISDVAVPAKGLFVTTTLAIVIFTVFIQGATIKSLVNLLHITKAVEEGPALNEEINTKVFEHIMAGVEVISGKIGHFYWQERLETVDTQYLKKWLCIRQYDTKMQKIFEGISLADHLTHLYAPSLVLNKEPSTRFTAYSNQAFKEGQFERSILKNGENYRSGSRSGSVTVTFSNQVTRKDRKALTSALRNDPIKKYHQVYDKNIVMEDDRDLEQVVAKRRQSARVLRKQVLENERVRRQSLGNDISPPTGFDEIEHISPLAAFPRRSAPTRRSESIDDPTVGRTAGQRSVSLSLDNSVKVLKLYKQIEELNGCERESIEALMNSHEEMRRRKSSNSATDRGYDVMPTASAKRSQNPSVSSIHIEEEDEVTEF